jgi:hypothetical protein
MDQRPSPALHFAAAAALGLLSTATAADLHGNPFYGDPPDAHHPWAVHDRNRPQPPLVTPGTPSTPDQPGRPPSDAVILFDGTDLSQWASDRNPGEPTEWVIEDGAMQCVPGSGYVRTREEFGDCQLHVEWAAPAEVEGDSQGRGNSGVFLMGEVEVQVLDNYDNPTYADGFAGSVYGINPPLANALRPPGEFQVYDIVFRRPVFRDGVEVDPGRLTVFCNGVLVQDSTPLEGPGGHQGRSNARPFPGKGPLKLQDHGNPVRYRNIWYRPLPPRAVEGGTDGRLTEEASLAKREEIAAQIRADAAEREGHDQLLRLMESLCYADDAEAREAAVTGATAFAAAAESLEGEPAEAEKGEVMEFRRALTYLIRCGALPDDFAPKASLDATITRLGWDERRRR